MRKIGVAISKGGVGKTTTAVNLAAGLARLDYKVLLIDTDTQGQAGIMLGVGPDRGLADFILNDVSFEDSILEARDNLFLLSGGRKIAGMKQDIAKREFRSEFVLKDALENHDTRFDFVIIDTGPGWDSLTVNILFYVDEILVPVSTEVMTIQSLVGFQDTLKDIQEFNKGLEVKYILPTFVDGRVRKSDEIVDQLNKHYKQLLCGPIRYNVKISEAPGFGQTIFEYDRRSTGAHDYAKLVERIVKNGP